MNLISINELSKQQLIALLDQAQAFIAADGKIAEHNLLHGKIIANLFFENSTRTLCSFEIAAKKLGAQVLTLNINTSSVNKGESYLDTIANLQAMGVDTFIVRHQENGIMQKIADFLGGRAELINAGEGETNHPTQALADVLTIRQHNSNFSQLTTLIAGDLSHSRVARSQIEALQKLSVGQINLVAPQNLLLNDLADNVKIFTDLNQALANVDVITMLRIQTERLQMHEIVDLADYIQHYQLNASRLALAKPTAIVLHPGPINRNVEITDEVADGKQSVILQQVHNGVAVRMAVLAATN